MGQKRPSDSTSLQSFKRQQMRKPEKVKHYAIIGGDHEGVHHSTWSVVKEWSQGISGCITKACTSEKEAQEWLHTKRTERSSTGEQIHSLREAAHSQLLAHNQASIPQHLSQAHLEGSKQIPPDNDLERTSSISAQSKEGNVSRQPDIPNLSEEQRRLVDLVVLGRNIFFTGSAGVGKSTVLKAIQYELARLGKKMYIIAPTGRAACDLQGQTTYTYAGWTPTSIRKPLKTLLSTTLKGKKGADVRKRLTETETLVIDEISMVDNLFLQRLDALMKHARKQDKPFGGVQMVITGDFCQLPPVQPFETCIDCGEEEEMRETGTSHVCLGCNRSYEYKDQWAFNSEAWKNANLEYVNLNLIHRQKDIELVQILQKVRLGEKLLHEERDLLLNHKCNTKGGVKLFPHKYKVNEMNKQELRKLPGEERVYLCQDDFRSDDPHNTSKEDLIRAEAALESHRFDSKVELKNGMPIILLTNLNVHAGLVNGAQGIIIGFRNIWPEDQEMISDEFKLDCFEHMLDNRTEQSRRYRATQILQIHTTSSHKEWPVVRFRNGIEKVITPECLEIQTGSNYASRTQIPLTAAWAMTIHKSQGMTLDAVEVDLEGCFEPGHAYVALSRARELQGLKVLSFISQGMDLEVKRFLRENELEYRDRMGS